MAHINIDYKHCSDFISKDDILQYQHTIEVCHKAVLEKTAAGNNFLGWTDVASRSSEAMIQEIEKRAKFFAGKAKLFVVVGIGGSYLGTRAVVEALQHHFALMMPNDKPRLVYAGHQLSEDYMHDLLQLLDAHDYALCVISKSGTTTEPALAFRILKQHLENKYGAAEAANRIVAITDAHKGALKSLATLKAYPTFVVPDDIGGRFSVLSPVGLLPIAVAGYDIRALLKGAREMEALCCSTADINTNPAALYAALRHALLAKGKTVEIMVNYLPALSYMAEWWKQLFGESEGKEHKGIFPAAVNNTTDLHSMGQYVQDGQRILFETVLSVSRSKHKISIPYDAQDLDGLNYLRDKDMTEINRFAEMGTCLAHVDGGVPNIRIEVPRLDEEVLGALIYFYEFACALSAYMLEVNPFDQPGVEDYKKNMFALLGKSGYEDMQAQLLSRLHAK